MTGYVLLFFGQMAVAANVIVGKLLSERLPVLSFVSLRFLISAALFVVAILMTKERLFDQEHPIKTLRKSDIYLLIAQALSGGFLFNALFFEGVKHTTATLSGVIAASLPAFLVIFSFFLLKERPSMQKMAAVLLTSVGIAILAQKENQSPSFDHATSLWGFSLVLSAMVPQALYSIWSRQLRGRISVLWAALFLNSLTFLLMAPFGFSHMTSDHWSRIIEPSTLSLIVVSGFFSFLFFTLWTMGMRRTPASTAAVFGGVLPLATTVLAWVFLGESLSGSTALGMFCVLFSLYWGTRGDKVKVAENRGVLKSN